MSTHWQDAIEESLRKERLARKILGVSAAADLLAIKKAFWLLAMQYHPDRNPKDREAARTFQNIVNAYEYLTKSKNAGWRPEADCADGDSERIGKYLANDWGYFCWWRENFEDGGGCRKRNKRKIKEQVQPDSKPGDWW